MEGAGGGGSDVIEVSPLGAFETDGEGVAPSIGENFDTAVPMGNVSREGDLDFCLVCR